MTKYLILVALLIGAGAVMFFKGTSILNSEIKSLKKENASLKLKNDSIFLNIKKLELQASVLDKQIIDLKNSEADYVLKLNMVNKEISKIKTKYEKANSHSNNFTTTQIQQYFSDSLELR